MADDIRNCGDLDERLAPYVDGEDAPAARGAIEQHLRGCPPCERAAREERLARTMVHEHRDALCARAPDALKARCQQSAASVSQLAPRSQPAPFALSPPVSTFLRRWAPLSLAATLVIAVAGVFVFGLNDRVEALAASLAIDHVKCFKVNGTATEADAQASERAWEADQGWPIVVPQTEASRQLKLVGVRRCISSDGRVAHMMYTWRGEPLSVYVLQAEAGRDAASHTMGAQEIIWRANHRTYAVVSSDASRDLTPILDYIKVHVQ
jgi:anti-sigma factor RsiW